MVGKPTCGNSDTGSFEKLSAPAATIASVSSIVVTGRAMNGAEMFILRALHAFLFGICEAFHASRGAFSSG